MKREGGGGGAGREREGFEETKTKHVVKKTLKQKGIIMMMKRPFLLARAREVSLILYSNWPITSLLCHFRPQRIKFPGHHEIKIVAH